MKTLDVLTEPDPGQNGKGARPDGEQGAASVSARAGRWFPWFCGAAAATVIGVALYVPPQLDADAISFMDLADLLRAHDWAGAVNGYWNPLYPACLAVGRAVMHASVATELRAYFFVDAAIFVLGMIAAIVFADALSALRGALEPASGAARYVMDRMALRYVAVSLWLLANVREITFADVKSDTLLHALLLFGVAALLRMMARDGLRDAVWMGAALGLAFLTKSFALVFTLLAIATYAGVAAGLLRRPWRRVAAQTAVAAVVFAAFAGPYVAALSRQKGRLDFGDSGSLNYAWYVAHTERMHLENDMTWLFGASDVHLKHPERELLRDPQVLSYAQMPRGTNPTWFDPSYWSDGVRPHFRLSGALARGAMNVRRSLLYLPNHLEAPVLLMVLLAFDARPRMRLRGNPFWMPAVVLAIGVWLIYAMVNVEQRYVTSAWMWAMLTVMAALAAREGEEPRLARVASVMALALGVLAVAQIPALEINGPDTDMAAGDAWHEPEMERAAAGLREMGVRPGDAVACSGNGVCIRQLYWARLAGVQILAELYPGRGYPYERLREMANREQALAALRSTGVKVVVVDFATARVSTSDPAFRDWQQLGDTTLYALRLNP